MRVKGRRLRLDRVPGGAGPCLYRGGVPLDVRAKGAGGAAPGWCPDSGVPVGYGRRKKEGLTCGPRLSVGEGERKGAPGRSGLGEWFWAWVESLGRGKGVGQWGKKGKERGEGDRLG